MASLSNVGLQEAKEFVSIGKDILVAAAAIWAGVIGFLGLQTWRRELKGKSQFAKAKEVLKSVYRVREAFKHVRHPAIFQYEYPRELCDEAGRLKDEQRYQGNLHVYETRWKIMADAFNALEEQTLDAQVEWGADFLNVIIPLRKCKAELLIALQEHVEGLRDRCNRRQKSVEEMEKQSRVLYYTTEDPKHDEFTKDINEAVQRFEEKLRPLIR